MDRPLNSEARVEVTIEAGRSLVVIRFEGLITPGDLDYAHDTLTARLGGKLPAGLVLDARRSRPGYSPGQLLAALETCLEQASPQRCAFVSSELREDTLTLLETAGVPYAVRVRGFDDIDAAANWAAGL